MKYLIPVPELLMNEILQLNFYLVAEFYNNNLPNYKIKTCQTP